MKKIIIFCLVIAGVLLLFRVNPEGAAWMPKCYFYKFTGLECPACGTQRALHQLMHLNFSAAFHFNPFMIISFPYLASLVITTWIVPVGKFNGLRAFCYNNLTIKVYLGMVIGWWILRNII